jgi:hypothetical protein
MDNQATKVTFDLASIDTVKDANQGTTVELYHPSSGKDLGILINILGKDSDKFRQIQTEQSRRRTAKLQKTGFRAGLTSSDFDSDAIELLASCTTGWENMVIDKKDVPFTRENAVAIYTQYPWIKEQVDSAVGDRALFTKA